MTASPEIMLDLETFGNRPGSIIVAIGAVKFHQGKIIDEFYQRITPASCERLGLKMDTSTVLWWLEQSEAARLEITQTGRPICEVLLDFSKFIDHDRQPIWGNGSDFDNALLTAAYQAAEHLLPWKYSANRCYRTLKNLFPSISYVPPTIAHHALEDARAQAIHLIAIRQSLEDHAEALRQNALIPRSGLALADLLVRHRIIQSHVVDDPEGYDGGVILDRCYEAHAELIGPAPSPSPVLPTEYQPESWSMLKDTIYAAQSAIQIGIEYTQELLAAHDARLGRTTRSNKETAERMEYEIEAMKKALADLQSPNGATSAASSAAHCSLPTDHSPPPNPPKLPLPLLTEPPSHGTLTP